MSHPSPDLENFLYFTEAELARFSLRVGLALGLSQPHAQAIAQVVVAGQRDECDSHGLYRLLTCAHTVRTGKVSLTSTPQFMPSASASVVRIHAHMGFSPYAFQMGLPALVAATRRYGVAALVINHCVHFTALWTEIERITQHGLAALAMTPAHAWVAPHGGTAPTFGTNPIAFGWPRPGEHPYVFDFATSALARGDLELHARQGTPLPPGTGIDAHGRPSTDPQQVRQGAMLTFGGHKGSALATMVELMAGALIGDWNSLQSLAHAADSGAAPCHGELLLAFDPSVLGGRPLPDLQAMAEPLFGAITSQGARLPSQRRFQARERSLRNGIAVPKQLYQEICALAPDQAPCTPRATA